jgi:hypothetical protein
MTREATLALHPRPGKRMAAARRQLAFENGVCLCSQPQKAAWTWLVRSEPTENGLSSSARLKAGF